MGDEKVSATALNQASTEINGFSDNEAVQRHWPDVVKRRSFLKSMELLKLESFTDAERIEELGLQHRNGKLRIVLGEPIQHVAAAMSGKALQPLLQRHGLSRSQISFWVVHPGGRKVIDRVQKHLGMNDAQLRFSSPF